MADEVRRASYCALCRSRKDSPSFHGDRGEHDHVGLLPELVVDAAAVIACFQRLNRMADGIGIALYEQMVIMTAGLRDKLAIDNYATAANAPAPSSLKKVQAFLMKPLEGLMMRPMQKGIQKAQAKKDA